MSKKARNLDISTLLRRKQSPFENMLMSPLRVINFGPSQLASNNWGFVRLFESVCWGLEVPPTIGMFFSFYVTRPFAKGGWVTLGALTEKGLFKP